MDWTNEYDGLKLENQLCFPLYAVSREIISRYRPYLSELNLTYTQYITMLVLWERERVSAKELGQLLHLDSGTMTPVLKSLQEKGLLRRSRSAEDERVLIAELTEDGALLREKAASVPGRISSCVPLNGKDAADLYRILNLLLDSFSEP